MTMRNARTTVIRKALYHSSSPRYTLHHEWIGSNSSSSGGDSIVFLHGLFGNGKNLKTLAKKVVAVKETSGVLVDLRGHGRSLSQSGPHTFDACVRDVHTTLLPSSIRPCSTIMGHSWGGRIALQYVHFLLENNNNNTNAVLPELWLLDTVPGKAHDSVEQVLEAVQRIKDLSIDKQTVALQLENEHGLERGIAQWLAASIKKDGNCYTWGFDVEVVKNILPEFKHQDVIGMMETIVKEGGGRVHLVRGGANTAWDESPSTLSQLHELEQHHKHAFQVHILPKAGHWVHVDDLPGLLELVVMTSKQQQ
jgi:pimeloyl-ACP methyl ester carboxylesterase